MDEAGDEGGTLRNAVRFMAADTVDKAWDWVLLGGIGFGAGKVGTSDLDMLMWPTSRSAELSWLLRVGREADQQIRTLSAAARVLRLHPPTLLTNPIAQLWLRVRAARVALPLALGVFVANDSQRVTAPDRGDVLIDAVGSILDWRHEYLERRARGPATSDQFLIKRLVYILRLSLFLSTGAYLEHRSTVLSSAVDANWVLPEGADGFWQRADAYVRDDCMSVINDSRVEERPLQLRALADMILVTFERAVWDALGTRPTAAHVERFVRPPSSESWMMSPRALQSALMSRVPDRLAEATSFRGLIDSWIIDAQASRDPAAMAEQLAAVALAANDWY